MPKPVINNRINYNMNQIINRADLNTDQILTRVSGPTFGNIHITGDATVDGNMYIYGNTTVVDFVTSSFENNLILLNNKELSSGVTLVNAGIEIDRGTSENYRIIYNETSKTFRVGLINSTQPVALREETPMDKGVFIWSTASSTLVSTFDLPEGISAPSFTSSNLKSTNATLGTLYTNDIISGFATIGNIFVNGTLTSVNITSINIIDNNISTGTLIVTDTSSINNLCVNLVSSGTLASNNITCDSLNVAKITSTNMNISNITTSNINLNDTLLSNAIISTDIDVTNLNNTFGYFNNLNINNYPVISYNSLYTRDVGVAFKRYQTSNDLSSGDVITDTHAETFTLPSQITIDPDQCLFPNTAQGTPGYYNGWWIKFNNQIRRITFYSNIQKKAVLDSNWTSQPSGGDVVYLYDNSYVVSTFNESDKSISFGYTADLSSDTTAINKYINIRTNDIFCNKLSVMSDNNLSLSVNGGCNINKSLIVNERLGISASPTELMHLYSTAASNILIEGVSESIVFKNVNDNATIKLSESNLFQIFRNNTNVLCMNTNGNIGIHTTNTNNASINIKSNTLLCSDNNTGYLGINGGDTNTLNNGNAQIVLYGKNNASSSNIEMYIGNNFNIFNTAGNLLVNVNNAGILKVMNTTLSDVSTGSVIFNGGVNINCSTNSSSTTVGGALTINGGTSIVKDLYIGGNVRIDGNLNVSSLVAQPTLTIDTNVNCSINNYANVNLAKISTQNILTFYVTVLPSVTRDYCSFQFTLPSKATNLVNRGDCIVHVSGWTDDTNIIPLFNVIGVGIQNTKKVFVKFTSVNTSLHYLQFNCVYSSA